MEHWAAVPPHAFHEQPVEFEQAIAPAFDSHAAGVPVHVVPLQVQPAA